MNPAWKKIFGSLWLLFWTLSAGPVDAATKCFVSIAPQRYFVQKIGGSLVDVSILVSPGADPHTYEPKPRQMAELAQSALYFALGIDFEKAWLKRIAGTNRQLRIIHTDAGIEKINMAAHNHAKNGRHQNDRSRHHHGTAPDPHIWLSPPLVKQQAEHILRALIAVDPANQGHYKTNFAVFAAELEALDGELKALLAGIRGESFLVLHPSWGYFAHAYGLVQVPIEIEGKDPKPAQLQRLIGQAKAEAIKRVFVQPQFSAKNAETVAREIGGAVVYADPLAENWAENLRDVARKLMARER
jgi:zinc transport system substrate-binding protein